MDEQGNIQIGDTKSYKEHYRDLGIGDKSARELRRTFGEGATAEVVEEFLQGKAASRDAEVLAAVERRMNELGTTDIYKAIPKANEEGGEEF